MPHADIIVPRGGDNKVAIQLIVQHVNTQLQIRGFRVREELAHSETHNNQPMPNSLHVLPETPQVNGMKYIIIFQEINFFYHRSRAFILSYVTSTLRETNSFSIQIVLYV